MFTCIHFMIFKFVRPVTTPAFSYPCQQAKLQCHQ
ncbi:hypothetical protein CsSME_00012847 [Camellia sinensis var. sinensis]